MMDEIQTAIFEKLVSEFSEQIKQQNLSIAELKESVKIQLEATHFFSNRLSNLEKIPSEIRIHQSYSIPLFGKKITTYFVTVLLFLSIGSLGVIWFYYDDFKVLEYSKTVSFKEKDSRSVFEVLQVNSKARDVKRPLQGKKH